MLIDKDFKKMTTDSQKETDLDFIVMPKLDETKEATHLSKALNVASGTESELVPKSTPSRLNKKWILLSMIIVFLVGVLGYSGYFFYARYKNKQKKDNLSRTNIIVPPADEETKDLDNDGLTAKQEKDFATNPQVSDTDGDGLADGDEVNVYKTDPRLSDTDSDSYDDGREVARGYSPLSSSSTKATSQEIQSWADRIRQYKLHEPTETTLQLKAATAETAKTVIYSNKAFGYTVELPAIFAFREQNNSQQVGIYIAGSTPEDTEVETDPISITSAVKTPSQTLREWIDSQYAADSYQKSDELTVNSIAAVKLSGIKTSECSQDKTFLPKDGVVIILTFTCRDLTPFAQYYESLVQSFSFK